MIETHVLGYPRFGGNREYKKALEEYWGGKICSCKMLEAMAQIRATNRKTQQDAGLSYVTVGDFAHYDHILALQCALNLIPKRFGGLTGLDAEFAMARGDVEKNIAANEMSKWFNTNYHFIVPEIEEDCAPKFLGLGAEYDEIAGLNNVKAVITGIITFLSIAKGAVWANAEKILAAYCDYVAAVAAKNVAMIQFDEPILASDLPAEGRAMFAAAYEKVLAAVGGKAKTMVTTYFDTVDENIDLLAKSAFDVIHLDLDRGNFSAVEALAKTPAAEKTLSLGVVDGRNVWKNDFSKSLGFYESAAKIWKGKLMFASSCSLLHSPVDLDAETKLDPEIKDWMAFAKQKCSEVSALSAIAAGNGEALLAANKASMEARAKSAKVNDLAVQKRAAEITEDMAHRCSPYAARKIAQNKWLKLPPFPTTTIGSFPQTPDIRKTRLAFKRGEISEAKYVEFMQAQIADVVARQEELGLDVLVHGEPERNDMVEYFGQQLKGFCFTQNGWVQSYGSRGVKPPVIFGDVSRPAPMTVEWSKFAQSCTSKPMKGMLTGPVTILCWSFVRNDIARSEVCRQIALAIRDEVSDLEKAGIKIIQIDEAALSEGMPVKTRDREDYFKWAVGSFRIATSSVADETQIHTHMCYSEFNKIIRAIADMDADVISIESSRSKMEILGCFADYEYPNEIGPGVYDIHSPRVPTADECYDLLQRAVKFIPAERLWVNPDCGLKTRAWAEVTPSLVNMVEAAKRMRNA